MFSTDTPAQNTDYNQSGLLGCINTLYSIFDMHIKYLKQLIISDHIFWRPSICISLTVSDLILIGDFCAAQIQGRIRDFSVNRSGPGQMSRSDFNMSVLAVYLQ